MGNLTKRLTNICQTGVKVPEFFRPAFLPEKKLFGKFEKKKGKGKLSDKKEKYEKKK